MNQIPDRNACRPALTALVAALVATSLLPSPAEAGGCGRGGGGYAMSYRSAPQHRLSSVSHRSSKVAEAEAAKARLAKAETPNPKIADKVPANAGATAQADSRSTEANVAQAVLPPTKLSSANGAVDCKRFVPSAAVTISVPCG